MKSVKTTVFRVSYLGRNFKGTDKPKILSYSLNLHLIDGIIGFEKKINNFSFSSKHSLFYASRRP